nr:ESX-1 secretion-associated protein EspI-like [Bactrocera oleae]
MKLITIATFVAVLAFACAEVSELGYGYNQPAASAPVNSYIPPAANAPEPAFAPAPVYQPAPAASAPSSSYLAPKPAASEVYEQPAQDGYRYRTVRRRVYKQRRY